MKPALSAITTNPEAEASYQILDGFKCYAPELARRNDCYPVEGFERLSEIEDTSFWFRSRNRIIQNLFRKCLDPDRSPPRRYLEIGCGTGYVLKGLACFANLELHGAELHLEGLKYAKKQVPQAELIQVDATRLPFHGAFDAIGAFDMLEHIENDETVMQQVLGALKPGGFFFVTVPQHAFLWSTTDDIAFHKRRYSRVEMLEKLQKAGFAIERVTSFVFVLFPFLALSRLLGKLRGRDGNAQATSEQALPPPIQSLFYFCMRVDEVLIRMGLSLPWGGSLAVVAKKPTSA